MAFNLKEYILFRTEIKRELFNEEVDRNFQAVANPWTDYRRYEIGDVVYHPVVIESITGEAPTTGEPEEFLVWWRANKRTTLGTFIMTQWDIIGGVGGFTNITIAGTDSFGNVLANWNAPLALPWNMAFDGDISANSAGDTLKITAGTGISIGWNQAELAFIINNTGAMGEVNNGVNIGNAPGAGSTGIDGPYDGMIGLDLSFYGLHARNDLGASPGNALSAVLDINNNLVYNLDQGEIDLGELNFGCPTLDLLCDVTYISGAPSAGQILQWNGAEWQNVDISVVGATNIYETSTTFTDPVRIATLNAAGGQLRFAGNGTGALVNPGLGIDNTGEHFTIGENADTTPAYLVDFNANDALDFQLRLNQGSAGENAAIVLTTTTADYIFGINGATDSFTINGPGATSFGGLAIDNFSIDSSNQIWIPDWAPTGAATLLEHYIPFANDDATDTGLTSTDQYLIWTYDGTDGTSSNAKTLYINVDPATDSPDSKAGLRISNVPNEGTSDINFSIIANGVSTPTPTSSGEIITGILYGTIRDEAANIVMNTGVGMYNGLDQSVIGFESTPIGAPTLATEFSIGFGSKMSPSANSQFGVSSIILTNAIAWDGSTRIGIFADVINDYVDFVDVSDTGIWAGFFRGCVNITEGGLVLGESVTMPDCNIVTGDNIEDRTLWINSANGHLYRGDVDIEGGGSDIHLCDLADVDCSTPFTPTDGDMLVYNSSTLMWEATDPSLVGNNIYTTDGTQTDAIRTYTGLGAGSGLNFTNIGTYSTSAVESSHTTTNLMALGAGSTFTLDAVDGIEATTTNGHILLQSQGGAANLAMSSDNMVTVAANTFITLVTTVADINLNAADQVITNSVNSTLINSGSSINLQATTNAWIISQTGDVDIDSLLGDVTIDAPEGAILLTANTALSPNRISLQVGMDATDYISIETMGWSSGIAPTATSTHGPPLIRWENASNVQTTDYAMWGLPWGIGTNGYILQMNTGTGNAEWVDPSDLSALSICGYDIDCPTGGIADGDMLIFNGTSSAWDITPGLVTIYTGDSQLTGVRDVDLNGNTLTFEAIAGLPIFTIDPSAAGGIRIGNHTVNGYTIPLTDGTPGQILATDGSGVVSWVDDSVFTLCDAPVDCPTGGPVDRDTLSFDGAAGSWNVGPSPALVGMVIASTSGFMNPSLPSDPGDWRIGGSGGWNMARWTDDNSMTGTDFGASDIWYAIPIPADVGPTNVMKDVKICGMYETATDMSAILGGALEFGAWLIECGETTIPGGGAGGMTITDLFTDSANGWDNSLQGLSGSGSMVCFSHTHTFTTDYESCNAFIVLGFRQTSTPLPANWSLSGDRMICSVTLLP